jgi:hypothetical protein
MVLVVPCQTLRARSVTCGGAGHSRGPGSGVPADSERIEDGLSRRQVLARGAVAAGVIWAAPVIRTATAYATSAAGTERPCTQFFLVACDALGTRPVRFPPDQPVYDDIAADATAVSTTSSTSTTTTTAPPATTTTTTPPATAAPTTTTTTTTTTPATGDASGTDSTSTTSTTLPVIEDPSSQDDFGLFPDPAPAVGSGTGADALPPDPHALAFSAAFAAAQAGTPDVLPAGIKTWLEQNPDVPVRYPESPPMLTQTSDEAWAVTLTEVGGPDPLTHQCRVVSGWATSKGKVGEFYLDPNPDTLDEFGRRGIFPNPRVDDLNTDPTALIDNIIFIFCCPQ